METVVYVALVALLSVLVVESIIALSKTFKAVRANRDIENSALVALDRMTREIRSADALGAGGIFGTTPSKLVLSYSGSGVTTREFSVGGDGAVHLFENGSDSGALTGDNILVTAFNIEQATTSTKTALRITLVLKDKRETVNPRSATFYTAAAMRNLY